ncbi:MAG: DUF2760 domain-containing protein [Deltaproteobacteria bacterium]|nr:DUF2760 domain-containing protein [Deltaproteobacteria bacterium]
MWFLLMGLVLAGFGYWQMGLNQYLQGQTSLVEALTPMLQNSGTLSLQVIGGCLVLFGVLLWLTLRTTIRRSLAKMEPPKPTAPTPKKVKKHLPPRPTPEEKEALARENQRRSLHLLSLLQREGRLVDFLEENLKDYDDAQIGAAVRNIQENCQKALKKYLKIEAVIDKEEGEEISLEKGFDASTIKLTGNVTGEPPFKGALQHCGWRVGQFDLPTLSGSPDPTIIAPAEVEVP